MSERRQCNGTKKVHGCIESSIEDCARSCEGRSSLFRYGRSDGECYAGKCICWCETSAVGGACGDVESSGFNLYKYDALSSPNEKSCDKYES